MTTILLVILLVAVIVLIVLLVSCHGAKKTQKVKSVEVEPPVVQVPVQFVRQVELRARAFDKHGYTVMRDDIEWSWDPEGSGIWVVSNLGRTATLELDESAQGRYRVNVSADGKPATAIVVAVTDVSNTDIAVVDPTGVPALAHVWGAPSCDEVGELIAFEQLGTLWANLVGSNCRSAAAVMSEKKELMYLSTPTLWTGKGDQVGEAELVVPRDGNINGVPQTETPPDLNDHPLLLPVKVWIAVDEADAKNAETDARRDVGTVNRVFERNRVGVRVVADYEVVSDLGETGLSCEDGQVPTPVEPKILNVYYLGWASGMPQGASCGYRTATSIPPETCEITPPEPGEFAYMYIYWRRRAGTTLVHELGHALGLSYPYVQEGDHTGNGTITYVEGLTSDNVMWVNLDADIALSRESFSIGQVFRMVVDEHSWLNRAPGVRDDEPTENCCLEPNMCPKLAFSLKDLDWSE